MYRIFLQHFAFRGVSIIWSDDQTSSGVGAPAGKSTIKHGGGCELSSSDGWQRQTQPADLADGARPLVSHRQAALAAATQTGVDSVKQSQFKAMGDDGQSSPGQTDSTGSARSQDHGQTSLPVPPGKGQSDSVEQSQFTATEDGHSRPCEPVKQSQSAGRGPGVRSRGWICETKPIRSGERWAQPAFETVKQSQLAGQRPVECEVEGESAKQSQSGEVSGGEPALRTPHLNLTPPQYRPPARTGRLGRIRSGGRARLSMVL